MVTQHWVVKRKNARIRGGPTIVEGHITPKIELVNEQRVARGTGLLLTTDERQTSVSRTVGVHKTDLICGNRRPAFVTCDLFPLHGRHAGDAPTMIATLIRVGYEGQLLIRSGLVGTRSYPESLAMRWSARDAEAVVELTINEDADGSFDYLDPLIHTCKQQGMLEREGAEAG
jgi:hypothetical protein